MKRVGIIGAGRFGTVLAEQLSRGGIEVLLLDEDMDLVQRLSSIVTKAVQGDARDLTVLSEAGFQDCDAVVVALSRNMESSALATINLRDLNVPHIISKASTDAQGRILERIGAHHVIYPDRERAQRLAKSLLIGTATIDYFEIFEKHSVVEQAAPEAFVGKSLMKANIRKKHGVTVLAIRRAPSADGQREVLINPDRDAIILQGDTLVIFGSDARLRDLQ